MRCPGCGTHNPETARFCGSCGARVALLCPQCGAELPSHLRFCDACGAPQGPVSPPPEPVPEETPDVISDRIRRYLPQGAEYADPHDWLKLNPDGEWNGWRHPQYERLVEQADRTLDQQQRMQLYIQADRILIEEAALMPLMYARIYSLRKPWLTRSPISPITLRYFSDVVLEHH